MAEMTPDEIVRHIEIVKGCIASADYRTQTMRVAASERRSAGDPESEAHFLKLARESEAEALALSSLLAVVEAVGKLRCLIAYNSDDYVAMCRGCGAWWSCMDDNGNPTQKTIGSLHPQNGCLKPIRQQLSEVPR